MRDLPSPDQADALTIAYCRLKGQVSFFFLDTTPPRPTLLTTHLPTAPMDADRRRNWSARSACR